MENKEQAIDVIVERMMYNLARANEEQKREIIRGLVELLGDMQLIALKFAVDMSPIRSEE